MEKNRKVVWKAFLDPSKEDAWLNSMCAQGWAMIKVGGLGLRFVFESCQPKEFIYASEPVLLAKKKRSEYFQFIKDTNTEIVFRQGWNIGYTYYRKKMADGPFEIYSDAEGKIKRLKVFGFIYVFLAWLSSLALLASPVPIVIAVRGGSTFAEAFGAWIRDALSVASFVLLILIAPIMFSVGYRMRHEVKQLEKEKAIKG